MSDLPEGWTMIVEDDKIAGLVESVRNNIDPYGAVVIGSTICVLANLATGSEPAQAFDDGVDGSITGFQAGAIASLVSQLSPRGEEFRRWWNLREQIGSEGTRANERPGAVLNPALLNVDMK